MKRKSVVFLMVLLVLCTGALIVACKGAGGTVAPPTTAQATAAVQTMVGGVSWMQNHGSSYTETPTSDPNVSNISYSLPGLSMTGT